MRVAARQTLLLLLLSLSQLLLLLLLPQHASCQQQQHQQQQQQQQQLLTVTAEPADSNETVIIIVTNNRMNVSVSINGTAGSGNVTFSISDTRVARLTDTFSSSVRWHGNASADYVIEVLGVRLGWSNLLVHYRPDGVGTEQQQQQQQQQVANVRLTVLQVETVQQQVYRVVIIVMVVLITFGMGCTIDVKVVWERMKRPIGLAIGWCSQFILMPHLALGIGQLLLWLVNMENMEAFAFGLLTVGCSPGGGSSNAWTLLFDADLDLSIAMTFFSTVCAMFMMPLWLFVYSRLYINVDEVAVPIGQVALTLLQLVIPVCVGVAVKLKFPAIARIAARCLRPFTLVFVLFIVGFGTYVNFFLYELIVQNPILIPFSAMVPWLGFGAGLLLALATRLPWQQAVAVSLDCGIQNVGIPILVLQFSMPQPEGDLASIVPLIVVIVTPTPLYFVLLYKRLREWRRRRNNETTEVDEEHRQRASLEAGSGVQLHPNSAHDNDIGSKPEDVVSQSNGRETGGDRRDPSVLAVRESQI